MKRKLVIVTALALCFAVSASTVSVAKTKKVKSTITLSVALGDATYAVPDTFFGNVFAKKGCKRKRKVVINGTALSTKTNNAGQYSITVPNISSGTYTATVKKKKRKKPNGVTIVCKRATSNPVVVP